MHHFSSLFYRVLQGACIIAGLLSVDAIQAEPTGGATQETLYTQKTVIHDAKDPAFAAYWSDKVGDIDFKALPQVYSARFTDADGRNLLVSTIHAAWPVCNVFGCPVRIQTQQGVRVLDRRSVCDLTEEHHLSADGHTLIACDEEFPIAGAGRAVEPTSQRSFDYHLYNDQRDFESVKDPIFIAYWSDLTDDLLREPSPPTYRSIDIGRFVDAGGRKLVVTTLHDPVECGLQVCPIRIFTEGGKRLLDSMACNETTAHRISAARRHLIACGQALEIPETALAGARTMVDAELAQAAQRASQARLEKISYDSGFDLDSPKAFAIQEYWRDMVGQINWKAPASARGKVYNWALPSADGRLLTLTMLQSGMRGVCDPLCPVRVFTAKHVKIMDLRVCWDTTQHGVSIDHRSFVACGEIFPIPQVDEITAIKANASPTDDPDAAVEVVRRNRSKPADAPKPVSVITAFHNGSSMLVSEWKDGTIEITYDAPRSGLAVAQGTLLFRGVKQGERFSGTAYTFKSGCAPASYPVTGKRDDKRDLLVLTGAAPHRDPSSCGIIGQSAQSGHANLVFDLRDVGDL